MKKLQLHAITAILVASTFIRAEAQTTSMGLQTKSFALLAADVGTNSAPAIGNKAGLRARKDFDMRFTSVPDLTWHAEVNVITASFNRHGIAYCAVYDKKGRWIRDIKNYGESKMAADIRELVKRSKYFDYKILFVQEVQEGDLFYYVVYLENEKTFKKVFVHDREITLYSDINKQLPSLATEGTFRREAGQ